MFSCTLIIFHICSPVCATVSYELYFYCYPLTMAGNQMDLPESQRKTGLPLCLSTLTLSIKVNSYVGSGLPSASHFIVTLSPSFTGTGFTRLKVTSSVGSDQWEIKKIWRRTERPGGNFYHCCFPQGKISGIIFNPVMLFERFCTKRDHHWLDKCSRFVTVISFYDWCRDKVRFLFRLGFSARQLFWQKDKPNKQ